MDTKLIIHGLLLLVTDAWNAESLYADRSHQIIADVHRVAPSHCRPSFIKLRATTASFFHLLVVAFDNCTTLCYCDQSALLPSTHNGYLPLDNETYSKHVGILETSIKDILDIAESTAQYLREIEASLILQLRSAAGPLGSYLNVVFPGFSSCMALIDNIPASFNLLIEALWEAANCFVKFGRRLLDFHQGVYEFSWGTSAISAKLVKLLDSLQVCSFGARSCLNFLFGGEESSASWLARKLAESTVPCVPRAPLGLLPDNDDTADIEVDKNSYISAVWYVAQVRRAAEKKEK